MPPAVTQKVGGAR